MTRDEKFMTLALECARKAALEGEVPVGAVCVLGDEIISVGCNRREGKGSALAHAEIEAIELACRRLGGWNLWNCELYVTLEPCVMCSGAIINSRIGRVVYGARDVKSDGGEDNLSRLSCRAQVVSGVLEHECARLLSDFFAGVRNGKTAWSPTKRILVGGEPAGQTQVSYDPCVSAVVRWGEGFVMLKRTDGLLEFPNAARSEMAPFRALREKCPSLVPVRRLVTVVERSENVVRDDIFVLCECADPRAIASAWKCDICCAEGKNMTAASREAYKIIKELSL